jgi:hypothetical protein
MKCGQKKKTEQNQIALMPKNLNFYELMMDRDDFIGVSSMFNLASSFSMKNDSQALSSRQFVTSLISFISPILCCLEMQCFDIAKFQDI